jgi:5-formyltetrahydrofolate cyclo-ligase
MSIPEKKADLRSAITARLTRLTPKQRDAESRSLCRRILELLPKEPSTICLYYPLSDEADVRPLLSALPALGHTVFLPRKEGKHFVFRKMESVESLLPDDFRIPAPADDADLLDPKDLTVALVPGRAFDTKGNRLGRGNGGYDVWIRSQRALNPQTKFWGVIFECQLSQDIPMEAHDERVDAVITARGFAH